MFNFVIIKKPGAFQQLIQAIYVNLTNAKNMISLVNLLEVVSSRINAYKQLATKNIPKLVI